MSNGRFLQHPHITKVIKCSFYTGTGTKEDPERLVTEYFDFSGNLIASLDHLAEKLDMTKFRPIKMAMENLIVNLQRMAKSKTGDRKRRIVIDFDPAEPDEVIFHIMIEGGNPD